TPSTWNWQRFDQSHRPIGSLCDLSKIAAKRLNPSWSLRQEDASDVGEARWMVRPRRYGSQFSDISERAGPKHRSKRRHGWVVFGWSQPCSLRVEGLRTSDRSLLHSRRRPCRTG